MKQLFVSKRGVLFITIVSAFLLSIFIVMFMSSKSDAKDYDYIYKSIRIEDGDTLNSLASRFLAYSGNSNHEDYVKQISRVNRLSSDKIIAGAYLVIPILDTTE